MKEMMTMMIQLGLQTFFWWVWTIMDTVVDAVDTGDAAVANVLGPEVVVAVNATTNVVVVLGLPRALTANFESQVQIDKNIARAVAGTSVLRRVSNAKVGHGNQHSRNIFSCTLKM